MAGLTAFGTQGTQGHMGANGQWVPGTAGTGGWLAPTAGAVSGLVNAYTGLENLGLAKDQYNFQSDLANRNLANQATLTNEDLRNRRNIGLTGSGLVGADLEKYKQQNPLTQVSGTAIAK